VNLLEVTKISKEKKSILYVQTSDVPARQYSPLVLAQTAKSMEIEAKVYYLGQSLPLQLESVQTFFF